MNRVPTTAITALAMLLGTIGVSTTNSTTIATAIVYALAFVVALHGSLPVIEKHLLNRATVQLQQAKADQLRYAPIPPAPSAAGRPGAVGAPAAPVAKVAP